MENHLDLIYREFKAGRYGHFLTVESPSNLYSVARKTINSYFPSIKIKPINKDSVGYFRFSCSLKKVLPFRLFSSKCRARVCAILIFPIYQCLLCYSGVIVRFKLSY